MIELGKLPPQNIKAEEAVLGAILIEKPAFHDIQGILSKESFYDPKHNEIYEACKNLSESGSPIDLLTVTNELRKNNKLDFVGGALFLHGLTDKIESAANLEFHARIIVECYLKRQLIAISAQIQKDSFDYSVDVFESLDSAQTKLMALRSSSLTSEPVRLDELAKANIKTAEIAMQAFRNGKKITGIDTGIQALNNLTGGWQKKNLIILAARPSMGKTRAAIHFAVKSKVKTKIASIEMGKESIANRFSAQLALVNNEKIRNGSLSNKDFETLQEVVSHSSMSMVYIDDESALTLGSLRSKCHKLKMSGNLQLLIVDYLQLMRVPDCKVREQEISQISRGLKAIAKDFDIPVIALAQLSRANETRGGDKRPMLSDLRESGAIEQDADLVIFIHRPEYYKIEAYENNDPTKDVNEFIVAKHRDGALDTVYTKIDPENSNMYGEEINGSWIYKSTGIVEVAEWNPSKFPQRDYTEPVKTEDDNTPF